MNPVDRFVLVTSAEMIDFIQKEYNAPDFDIKIRCDHSPRRTRSWGGIRRGVNFISLALNRYSIRMHYDEPMTFLEYPSFSNDPVIGTLSKVSWKKALSALIAHEISHAVTLGSLKQTAISAHGLDITEGGKHGLLWKNVYRKLRVLFVNNTYNGTNKNMNVITISNVNCYSKSYEKSGSTLIEYRAIEDDSLVGRLFKDFSGLFFSCEIPLKLGINLNTKDEKIAREMCFA
jgi:hypothetical protein